MNKPNIGMYGAFECYHQCKMTKKAQNTKREDSRELVFQFCMVWPLLKHRQTLIHTRPWVCTKHGKYYFPRPRHAKSSLVLLRPRKSPAHLAQLGLHP